MEGGILINSFAIALFFVLSLLGLFSGILLFWRLLGKQTRPDLAAAPLVDGVSVIIPARNEEKSLPALLSSLTQARTRGEGNPREIIVVDDESQDRTGKIAEELGCRVIRIHPRPEGWVGKSWACWQGALHARGGVLLFLDADTRFSPGGLAVLTRLFARTGGLLSVQPYHRTGRAVERLSLLFNLVVMAATGAFRLSRKENACDGAFGPCMMIGRPDYKRFGGHCAVKSSLIEDMALGRACTAHGIRVTLRAGRGIIEYRMYPGGFPAIVEGWTKNISSGAATAPAISSFLIGLWLSGASASLFGALGAAAAILGLIPESPWQALIFGGSAYLLFASEIYLLGRRVGSFGLGTALLYPFHLTFFCGVLLRSIYLQYVKHEVRWKGRSIKTEGRN